MLVTLHISIKCPIVKTGHLTKYVIGCKYQSNFSSSLLRQNTFLSQQINTLGGFLTQLQKPRSFRAKPVLLSSKHLVL